MFLPVAAGPDIGGGSRGFVAVPLVQVQLHRDGLSRIGSGAEHRAVALIGEILAGVEGLIVDLAALPPAHPVHEDLQGAGAGVGVLGAVPGPAAERIRQADIVGAARKLKIEVDFSRAVGLFQVLGRFFPGNAVAQKGRLPAEGGDIQNVQVAGNAGADNGVVDGVQIFPGNTGNACGNTQDGAHVSGVAVRIPARHGGDLHGAVEFAFTVEQGHHAHTGVGDDVADSGVFVVAPVPEQQLHAVPPVFRVGLVEGPDGLHDAAVGADLRQLPKPRVYDLVHIVGLKGLGNGGAHEPGAVDAVAVVGYAGGSLAVVRCPLGRAGIHQAPGIDEDLAADLLCHGLAVLADGAGLGGGNAVFQVQIGGVLRADAVAAPPEHTYALPGVVQPGPGHVLRLQRTVYRVIHQGPEEENGAVGVIVSGEIFEFLYVVVDVPVGIQDPLVGPDGGLHRRSQANAHVHPQKTGIHLLQIILDHTILLFGKIDRFCVSVTEFT